MASAWRTAFAPDPALREVADERDDVDEPGARVAGADPQSAFLRYGQSLFPINLWAVTDEFRTNGAFSSLGP